jgi:DNA-binding transcriptional ArsR family regulator
MTTDRSERARRRTLSSPLRLQILSFCMDEPHTNREVAEHFDLNTGTSLRHVRALVAVGLLEEGEPRRGRRNAIELPYRATPSSWTGPSSSEGKQTVASFAASVDDADPTSLDVWRVDLRLDEAARAELDNRITALLYEFRGRPMGAQAHPVSILAAMRTHSPEETSPIP